MWSSERNRCAQAKRRMADLHLQRHHRLSRLSRGRPWTADRRRVRLGPARRGNSCIGEHGTLLGHQNTTHNARDRASPGRPGDAAEGWSGRASARESTEGSEDRVEEGTDDIIDRWLALSSLSFPRRRSPALQEVDRALDRWKNGGRLAPGDHDRNAGELQHVLDVIDNYWEVKNGRSSRRAALNRLQRGEGRRSAVHAICRRSGVRPEA